MGGDAELRTERLLLRRWRDEDRAPFAALNADPVVMEFFPGPLVREEAHFTPAVEVGWRLSRSAWGHGYATEAGRASLAHGFEQLGLGEVVSMTTVTNARSRAVMERLGMSRDPADDFELPTLPPGDPLRPHVLYRITGSAASSAKLA